MGLRSVAIIMNSRYLNELINDKISRGNMNINMKKGGLDTATMPRHGSGATDEQHSELHSRTSSVFGVEMSELNGILGQILTTAF